MKKIIVTLVIVLVTIGGTYLLFRTSQDGELPNSSEGGTSFPAGTSANDDEEPENPELPIRIEESIGNESTMTLKGSDGSTFTVPNFIENGTAIKDPYNPTNYKMGERLSGLSTGEFSFTITFIETSRFFNITLNREPLRQSRQDAETYLRELLGIRTSDMCSLNYMVSVPGFVNETFSGENLRFSFCPGAVALP